MTPTEIEAAAQRWYDQQLARAAAAHGAHWPADRQWVEAYLLTELRQRLTARGWRLGE